MILCHAFIFQVKILREDEESGKVGPDGKPRSKGLGFIEFRCVRKMEAQKRTMCRQLDHSHILNI
jgi:hypothetical protein